MRRRLLVAATVLAVAACGQGARPEAAAADRDTLTRRQKDSLVSTLPIPGASKVGDAMEAVDRANARVRQHDTIR
jgi:hypothetical protein